jgi:uncharacterized protein YkwD
MDRIADELASANLLLQDALDGALRVRAINFFRGATMPPILKKAALLAASVGIGMSLAVAGVQDPVEKSKAGRASPAKDEKPVDPIAAALLAAHNRVREAEGKGSLALSEQLCQAAAVHAKDMAKHRTPDHVGSDKSTVADRVKRTGYAYVVVGENIADGQKTVEQVMTGWLESPGHRENILADFTEMGGARAKDDQGINYWCVALGTPIKQLKPKEAAAAVVKYVNEDRKKRKKPVLKAETRIGKMAMELSAVMAKNDKSELKGDPFKLIETEAPRGREFRIMASGNAPTHVEAAKAVMGEDASALDDYREIGVGYAIARNGTPYWCTILAKQVIEKPRAVRIRERQNKAKSDEP